MNPDDHVGDGAEVDARPEPPVAIEVALGRRVVVIGDLLLPPTPSPSSLAGAHDIEQLLTDWQGPGIVVVCGQLIAPGCDESPGPATALAAHDALTGALRAFAARPDSRVIALGAPTAEARELNGALRKIGASTSWPAPICAV